MEKEVYIHVCNGIADWEMALASAMISKAGSDFPKNKTYNVVSFSLDKQPIKTMGGVNIHPDICINDIDILKCGLDGDDDVTYYLDIVDVSTGSSL